MEKIINILVVDDDSSFAEIVKIALILLGYHVWSAFNGIDALQILKKHSGNFDLLLSDISMPKMNGYELAKASKEKYPGVKVIFMSGEYFSVSDDSVDYADFITKPFTMNQLKETVAKTCMA